MSDTAHQQSYPSQRIFGLPFFNGNISQAVDCIWKNILENEFVSVATPNPEQIVQARHDSVFSQALSSFDIFLPDGNGILWAGKKFHTPLSERIAGVDVVKYLVEKLQADGLVGLVVGGYGLGDSGELTVNSRDAIHRVRALDNKAAQIYKEKENKKLANVDDSVAQEAPKPKNRFIPLNLTTYNVQPTTNLFWLKDFDKNSRIDNEMVQEWISKNHPVIVFVALGAPYQEVWIMKHREILKKAGVRCVMAVGGSFDVLTGKTRRAPDIVQTARLEWLWRLLQQPWRWKRQLRLIEFVGTVVKGRKGVR